MSTPRRPQPQQCRNVVDLSVEESPGAGIVHVVRGTAQGTAYGIRRRVRGHGHCRLICSYDGYGRN